VLKADARGHKVASEGWWYCQYRDPVCSRQVPGIWQPLINLPIIPPTAGLIEEVFNRVLAGLSLIFGYPSVV